MEPTGKLRVAIPDRDNALEVVTTEIEEATGISVAPEFQEIDRGDLVVEVRLDDADAADAELVAHAVERLSGSVVVLSSWQEVATPAPTTALASQSVFVGAETPMPEVARRALQDDLPTAKWPSNVGDPKGYWQVAVPFHRHDGEVVVGFQQRSGYSRRFGTHEVAALRLGLAS
jgi:hypothetical protein